MVPKTPRLTAKKNKSKSGKISHGLFLPSFNRTGCFSVNDNTTLEWQLSRWPNWNYFRHHLNWTRKRDHAGMEWEIEILGLTLTLNLHDNRHWDYEHDKWEEHKR